MYRSEKNNNRRSFVVIDSFLYSSENRLSRFKSVNNVSDISDDEQFTKTIEALSLESTVVWEKGQFSRSFAVEQFQLRDDPTELVQDLLNDLVDLVVDRADTELRELVVESYLSRHLPAPLVKRAEVTEIGSTLSGALSSLEGSSSRLKAAWRIILVSTAQQLNTSFRRILIRRQLELNAELDMVGLPARPLLTEPEGVLVRLIRERENFILNHQNNQTMEPIEDSSEFKNCLVSNSQPWDESGRIVGRLSAETVEELRHVTNRILDLSVVYLKGATSDVVDSAVHEIKNVVSEQTRL